MAAASGQQHADTLQRLPWRRGPHRRQQEGVWRLPVARAEANDQAVVIESPRFLQDPAGIRGNLGVKVGHGAVGVPEHRVLIPVAGYQRETDNLAGTVDAETRGNWREIGVASCLFSGQRQL